MIRGAQIGLVVAVFATLPAIGHAADAVSIPNARATIRHKTATIDTAEAAVLETRKEQLALEHRITALKRLVTGNKLGSQRELEALLRQSVAADQTLATRRRTADTARADLVRWVGGTVRAIDLEVKSLAPAMKTGELADRKNAARRIGRLLKLRKRLDAVAKARRASSESTTWQRYVDVQIDPLDGPSELAEKADFVEDTRDKYERKRRAIMQLLESAKRERDIRRAARELRDDLAMFDEESRSVRVPRTAQTTRVASVGDATNVPRGGNVETAQPPQSPPPETTLSNSESPAPPAPARTDNDFSADPTAVGVKVTTNDSAPAVTRPTSSTPTPTIIRAVDAQGLIGLRLDELGKKDLDPATLERLLQELSALDAHLASQAKAMRARARALEADEARARQK